MFFCVTPLCACIWQTYKDADVDYCVISWLFATWAQNYTYFFPELCFDCSVLLTTHISSSDCDYIHCQTMTKYKCVHPNAGGKAALLAAHFPFQLSLQAETLKLTQHNRDVLLPVMCVVHLKLEMHLEHTDLCQAAHFRLYWDSCYLHY